MQNKITDEEHQRLENIEPYTLQKLVPSSSNQRNLIEKEMKDEDVQKEDGHEDVDLSSFLNSPEYLSFFNCSGDNYLNIACFYGRLDVVKKLLQNGYSVNILNNDNETPLHYSSWKGHLEVVKHLIENNANIDAQNNDGETALHWSSANGFADIAEYLCSKNASVHIKNKNHKTPLDFAIVFNRTEVIDILKKYELKE